MLEEHIDWLSGGVPSFEEEIDRRLDNEKSNRCDDTRTIGAKYNYCFNPSNKLEYEQRIYT